MNKYLPSKKFQYLLGSFLVIALLFFAAFKLLSGKNSFFAQRNDVKVQAGNLTINEMITKDSDGDGVPDWEEALWGTDPNNKETFGMPDATYIANKRKALNVNQPADNGTPTQTDNFARDFFAAYNAMKTSGQVDDATIKNFSSALGQKIVDSSVVDQYSEKDLKLADNDDPQTQADYYASAAGLFAIYKESGLGDELEIAGGIASTGQGGDTKSEDQLQKIAGAYQEFAQKLLLVPVPKSLVQYHLEIINSANNTGIAVSNMSKMISDPVTGLSGISQYQKYSSDLITSANNLEAFLIKNGIIIQ